MANENKSFLKNINIDKVVFYISLIGIIILINILTNSLLIRIDTTENNRATISKRTVEVLRKIEDVVHVRIFFSHNLPSPHNRDTKILKEIMEEFKLYAGGNNFKYEFIDPVDDVPQKVQIDSMRNGKIFNFEKDVLGKLNDFKKSLVLEWYQKEDKYYVLKSGLPADQKSKLFEIFTGTGFIKNRAEEAGIQGLQLKEAEGYQGVRIYYKGMTVNYHNEEISIPYVAGQMLEYRLLRIIKSFVDQKKIKIGILSDTKPFVDPYSSSIKTGNLSIFKRLFPQHALKDYELIDLNFEALNKKPIDKDVRALIVLSPDKARITDYQLYIIDKFVMEGKPVCFLLDGIKIQQQKDPRSGSQMMFGMSGFSKLHELVNYYGVEFGKGIVLDFDFLGLPYRPVVKNLNKDNIITKYTTKFDIFAASPVYPRKKYLKDKNVEYSVLAHSSKKSWHKKGQFFVLTPDPRNLNNMLTEMDYILRFPPQGIPRRDFDNNIIKKLDKEEQKLMQDSYKIDHKRNAYVIKRNLSKGTYEDIQQILIKIGYIEISDLPLAVTLKGKFKSYFSGKNKPEPEELGKKKKDKKDDRKKEKIGDVFSKKEAKIFVIGDSNFIQDQFLVDRMRGSFNTDNFLFTLNIIDWLCDNEEYIVVRNKTFTARPMDKIRANANKSWINFINIFMLPILVAIFSTIYWFVRRKRNLLIQSEFDNRVSK